MVDDPTRPWWYAYDDKPAAPDEGVSWGDYGKNVVGGAAETGEAVSALARSATDNNPTSQAANQMATILQQSFGDIAKTATGSMSPDAQQRLAATIGSPEFWSHPLSVVALKASRMAPALAATAIGSALTDGAVLPTIIAGVTNGALSAGQVQDAIYKSTDDKDDANLQETNSYYASLRSMGMDEKSARADLHRKLVDGKGAVSFAVGALAGAFGPAASVARGSVVGATESGIVGRAAVGAAEGAAGNAAQNATNDIIEQNANQQLSGQQFDMDRLVATTLEGGALGGVLGAAGGAVSARGKPKASVEAEAPAAAPEESAPVVKPEEVVQQPKSAGTGTAAPPNENLNVGNPDSAPTRSETSYPKAAAAAKKKAKEREAAKADTPEQAAVSADVAPDQAAALAAREPAPVQVQAADLVPEAPQPEPTPAPAPQPVPTAPQPEPTVQAPLPQEVTPVSAEPPKPAPVDAQPARVSEPQPTENNAPAAISGAQDSAPAPEPAAKPVKTGRVLRPVEEAPEVVAANKKAFNQLDKNAKSATEAEAEANGDVVKGGKNLTSTEKNTVADTIASAEKITQDNAPAENEEAAATIKRAQAMVAAADEAGVKIPRVLKSSKQGNQSADSEHVQLLRYAADLAQAAKGKSKPKVADAVLRFREREQAVRGGHADEALSARKAEGDQAKRKDQGNVEEMSGDEQRGPNAVRSISDGTEKGRVITKEGNVEEVARAKAASEVRKVSVSDDEKAAMIARLNAAMKKPVAVHDIGATHPLVDAMHAVIGDDAAPAYSTKLSAALSNLNLDALPGVAKNIAPFVVRRLAEATKNVDMHVLNQADMRQVRGRAVHGFYVHKDGVGRPGYVVVSADVLKDPNRVAHVVMHEAMHAAVAEHLEASPRAKKLVNNLRQELILGAIKHDRFDDVSYATTNEHEFLSEAFSNPLVQDLMSRIDLPAKLAKELGLGSEKLSLWNAFLNKVRDWVGMPKGTHSLLEGALRAGADLMDARRAELTAKGEFKPIGSKGWSGQQVHALEAGVKSWIAEKIQQPEKADHDSELRALWVRSTDNIARAADRFFGENNPVRKVHELLEKTHVLAGDYLKKSEPTVQKLFTTQREYQRAGKAKVFQEFADLANDVTMAGVHPDRPPEKSNDWNDAWRLAQHPDLARRYEALPDDLKKLYHETRKYYEEQQNGMGFQLLRNVLHSAGYEDEALARRVFENNATEEDIKHLGPDFYKLLRNKEMGKVEGPYFPLMRRGDYVVSGHVPVTAPGNGKLVNHNTVEFATRDEAVEFAKNHDLQPDLKKTWVDKDTGLEYGVDEGGKVKLGPEDTNAEARYRVELQNKHVEFFARKGDALAAHKQLEDQGLKDVTTRNRRRELRGSEAERFTQQMHSLVRSVRGRQDFRDMPDASKEAFLQMIAEASTQNMASTRLQSRRIPRRNVLGASTDITRNALDYAQSMSSYRARLDHGVALSDAMKELHDRANEPGKGGLAKTAIYNEMEKRTTASDAYSEGWKTFNDFTRRLLTWSYLDKLAGPSHNIVNSLQTGMVGLPVLAGRHGWSAATRAVTKAYSDIGGLGLLKGGLKATIEKVKNQTGEVRDVYDLLQANLSSAKEKEFFDRMREVGSIGGEAGMEYAPLIKSSDGVMAKVDNKVAWVENIARQMPKAIEVMNRGSTGLAAFRLELAKTGDFEKAVRYGIDTTNETQGLYSPTNNPAWMRHPLAKLPFQFKNYGRMMYQLFGSNIAKVMDGATREEKIEGLKTLASLTATHVAMAGALGLPTEPFKYLLMIGQGLGLTSTSWGDVENKVRETAAGALGKTGGELLTRGLPRLLGVDVSGRLGLDSVATFGEPRQHKEADVKSWILDQVMGAPGSLVADYVKGANLITSGQYEKGAELMVPLKVIADSIRAYRQATEGKKDNSGHQTSAPYSAGEAITRAMGFTPRREAEEGAARSAFYSKQTANKGERGALINGWVNAKPADKTKAFAEVQKFNRGKAPADQIKMKELTSAGNRRTSETSKGSVKNGMRIGKHDKAAYREAEATYNTGN